MLSSREKISYFRAKAHLVFHWCLYNNWTTLTLISHTTDVAENVIIDTKISALRAGIQSNWLSISVVKSTRKEKRRQNKI